MSLKSNRILIAIATVLISLTSSTSHAALVFTNGVDANFRFEIVAGPLASQQLPVGTILDFVARGSLTFTLDDSVANASNMAFTNATGALTVVTPFAGATMGPHEFVSGQFQNITRDGVGNITGGNVVDLRMRWQMFVPNPNPNAPPTRLYTSDTLPFNGAMTGTPFQIGNVLAGPTPFNVYLDAGLGNPGQPGGDPLAVIGSNRFLNITAVPEPSSFTLIAVIGLGCAAFRIRRSKP